MRQLCTRTALGIPPIDPSVKTLHKEDEHIYLVPMHICLTEQRKNLYFVEATSYLAAHVATKTFKGIIVKNCRAGKASLEGW